jgi:hypothetical protein
MISLLMVFETPKGFEKVARGWSGWSCWSKRKPLVALEIGQHPEGMREFDRSSIIGASASLQDAMPIGTITHIRFCATKPFSVFSKESHRPTKN